MLTPFQWFSLFFILLIGFAGGYFPLIRHRIAGQTTAFPLGQAFTTGVFLALSLTMMLPAGYSLLGKALPNVSYPVASLISLLLYLVLLAMEHMSTHAQENRTMKAGLNSSRTIPVIMTVMIAIPSFFLGTALAMSQNTAAFLVFLAVVVHKGSAGFALALKIAGSNLSRRQGILLFSVFAFATPIGILVGANIQHSLAGQSLLLIKGTIMAMAAGTFLYMGTIHEMKHTPLIEDCGTKRGFMTMLAGFALTALVRLLIGEIHHN